MFFELRQYRIKANQMAAWVKYMEDVIIPYQVSKGMTVVGSFTAPQEPDLYVWIRRFNNQQEYDDLCKAVYDCSEWKDDISPQVSEMLDRERIVVTHLVPTAASLLR